MTNRVDCFSQQPDPQGAGAACCRWQMRVRGIVQGVGFRPFVYNTARQLGLVGWVKNTSGEVHILIEGPRANVESFVRQLQDQCPLPAWIESMEVVEQLVGQPPLESFQIIASSPQSEVRPTIPADLALCEACRTEIHSPTERRYRYPFTNCTRCGPRWSIIRGLPYDRPRTSMAHFAMCRQCHSEYEDPTDRRFHAQPIACPVCGPKLRLLVRLEPRRSFSTPAGKEPAQQEAVPKSLQIAPLKATGFPSEEMFCPPPAQHGQSSSPEYVPVAEADEALRQAAQAIVEGKIVALKGLGGFQLLCDATQPEVVQCLRERKHRPDKPFALMFTNLEQVRQVCWISETEAQLLQSAEAPIVLLRRRDIRPAETGPSAGTVVDERSPQVCSSDMSRAEQTPSATNRSIEKPPALANPAEANAGGQIAWAVAPDNPYLGVMLPYTPLHVLLMEAVGRPVVCTSGNLSEEPMAYRTEEAIGRLGWIAELILTHDRPIVRPVDDSVVRVLALTSAENHRNSQSPGSTATVKPHVQILRRARGYAPRPIELGFPMPPILALGGHLKNTVGLSLGSQVVLSQHVGDLDNLASLEVFQRTIEDLLSFFGIQPQMVVCDLHPDYASSQYAEQLAEREGVPLVRVQHHEAHMAACLAEQGLAPEEWAEPILGFAWDGSGYGWDGTIWGGEMLLWQGGRVVRVGTLRPFPLPGGDQAVREPRRSALGLLYELLGEKAWETFGPLNDWFRPAEQAGLRSMLRRSAHCPQASSMGRLFDALAALCGLGDRISFEGQAAMALEFAALQAPEGPAGSLPAYRLPWVEGNEKMEAASQTSAILSPPRQATALGQSTPLPPHSTSHRQEKNTPTFAFLDWHPMLEAILADRSAGVPAPLISRGFHAALAEAVVVVAQWAAHHWGVQRVALSGGCFQNALLTQWAYRGLQEAGFTVYLHQHVPPGDGGIALGQIFLAALASASAQRKP